MSLDIFLLNYINIRCTILDKIMIFMTNLGNFGAIWVLISLILMFFKKYRRYGVLILIILIFNFFIGDILIKNIVCRPRPFIENNDIILLIKAPSSYSFPSGHSSSSFAAAWTIIKFNKILGILSLLIAFLIAFSRVYLYVHYVSDVLAGIILGIIISQISYNLFKKYCKSDALI